MSANKKKKNKSRQGMNFVVTLVTLSVIFVFFGYLIGTYAVGALQKQHQTSVPSTQTRVSPPVVGREPSPATAQAPAPATTVTPAPATASPAQPPPASAPSESTPSAAPLYRVQVGVFSERANADRMLAMLKEQGYEGIIIAGPPHRVQTGAFSSQENAAKLVQELIQKGFEAIIVR